MTTCKASDHSSAKRRFDTPTPAVKRRTLLLVYIHGFCGSEQSFGQLPLDVHGHVQLLLRHTHSVYSKIYPRYETRHAMHVAVEVFSRWLRPHETSETDIILVGHSLGGILASEAALLHATDTLLPQSFRHHIIGTLSMDCPFLGLNLGIIVPGICSLFRFNQTSSISSSPSSYNSILKLDACASVHDTHFNPPFFNDAQVSLPTRIRKDGCLASLREAMGYYFSYWVYGRCLRRPQRLQHRYSQLRDLARPRVGREDGRPLLRFLNYYTASTKTPMYQQPEVSAAKKSFSSIDTCLDQEHSGKRGVEKAAKARTFCVIPQDPDPTWVRVSMAGVDEVTAHCGLFRDDEPHYEGMVDHMVEEIAQWVGKTKSE